MILEAGRLRSGRQDTWPRTFFPILEFSLSPPTREAARELCVVSFIMTLIHFVGALLMT